MKKFDFNDLIESGQLKREPNVGKEQPGKLLKRADRDLAAASYNKQFDEAIAMQAAYSAMFHAANALLRVYGYRPGPVRQHQGVIVAVSRILGESADLVIKRFDHLRKRRNELEYQGQYEMGFRELEEAIDNSKVFVNIIKNVVEKTTLP